MKINSRRFSSVLILIFKIAVLLGRSGGKTCSEKVGARSSFLEHVDILARNGIQ